MRGSDQIEFKCGFNEIRICLLGMSSHRIAHIGIRLMSIDAADLQTPSVQQKAIGCESGLTEAYPGGKLMIETVTADTDFKTIKHWLVHIP